MISWEWLVANPSFVADAVLGLLNLVLLFFLFVEARKTREISQRLTAIEETRDKAVLDFDGVVESKMFKPEDGDVWVFVRVANRGGKDSVLWPAKSGVLGRDEQGADVRLPFEIWATEELMHRQWANTSGLRVTLDATPGARHERDPEDYNIRAGQMREFFVRVFAQKPLDLVQGDEVRLTLAPVLGDAISTSLRMPSLRDAIKFVQNR